MRILLSAIPSFSFSSTAHAVVMQGHRLTCSLYRQPLQQIPCRRRINCRSVAKIFNGGCFMRKRLIVAAIAALAAGGMVGGATIALAQADVIKERQENRKGAAAAMRAIKGIIDAKGPTTGAVEQAAKLKTLSGLRNCSRRLRQGRDKALPTIVVGLGPASGREQERGRRLRQAGDGAGSGDMAALTAAFGDAGKACGPATKFRAKANWILRRWKKAAERVLFYGRSAQAQRSPKYERPVA